jgi:pimeloyl-ACP methyl ester carboxylesterase
MIGHAFDSALHVLRRPDAERWGADTRLLDTSAGRIRVRDTGGDKPALVMTPDGPCVIEHHAELIDILAADFRVICFDQPGFGFSYPRFGYAHRLDQGARALLAVMDALDVRRATLSLSCANGFYALAAAKLAPDRFDRLVLAQTPSLDAMQRWVERVIPRPLMLPVVGQALVRARVRKTAGGWFHIALPRGADPAPMKRVADTALREGGCFCLAGVCQGLAGSDAAQLEGVTTPVVLAWGDGDRSHRFTPPDSLRSLVPHAELHPFEGCGHFPNLEQPARFAALLRSSTAR